MEWRELMDMDEEALRDYFLAAEEEREKELARPGGWERGAALARLTALSARYKLRADNPVAWLNGLLGQAAEPDSVFLLAWAWLDADSLALLAAGRLRADRRFAANCRRVENFCRRAGQIGELDSDYRRCLAALRQAHWHGPLPNRRQSALCARLGEIFTAYIAPEPPLAANLEYLVNLAFSSDAAQALAPLLLWQAFVRQQGPLVRQPVILTAAALLRPKLYRIQQNNGKNYDAYQRYGQCFTALLDAWQGLCQRDLCCYGFQRLSNLAAWLLQYQNGADSYWQTPATLLVGSADSLFCQESVFWQPGLSVEEYRQRLIGGGAERLPLPPDAGPAYTELYGQDPSQAAELVCRLAAACPYENEYTRLLLESRLQALADEILLARCVEWLEQALRQAAGE